MTISWINLFFPLSTNLGLRVVESWKVMEFGKLVMEVSIVLLSWKVMEFVETTWIFFLLHLKLCGSVNVSIHIQNYKRKQWFKLICSLKLFCWTSMALHQSTATHVNKIVTNLIFLDWKFGQECFIVRVFSIKERRKDRILRSHIWSNTWRRESHLSEYQEWNVEGKCRR